MGYKDQRITEGAPEKIAAMSFVHPNVVIIKKTGDQPSFGRIRNPQPATRNAFPSFPRFGLREGEISHSKGLITKDEVRAVAIHALRLPEKGIFWDVGAGSGAVSIEVAGLCPGLDVFSVEKDEEQLRLIDHNRTVFGVPQITIVRGEAPAALLSLPAPDRVFVGGSSGRIGDIIDHVSGRMMKGIVVVNAATFETLNDALKGLEKAGFSVTVSEVSVARSKPIGDKRYLAALNPVFVVVGEKE